MMKFLLKRVLTEKDRNFFLIFTNHLSTPKMKNNLIIYRIQKFLEASRTLSMTLEFNIFVNELALRGRLPPIKSIIVHKLGPLTQSENCDLINCRRHH